MTVTVTCRSTCLPQAMIPALLLSAFTLLSAIQEEVHRSAIRYHRQRRKGSSLSTSLLEVEGIGPARAQALLRQFGSLRGVQNATIEELLLVKGMTRPAAEAIRRHFDNR